MDPNNKAPRGIESILRIVKGMFAGVGADKEIAQVWLSLETDLQHALQNKELFIQYQPIMDVQTGNIFGIEALVRWQHARFGIISPGDLIPLAEATGLALRIGEWILEEACAQAVKWHGEKLGSSASLKLAVNLTVAQLRQNAFLKTLDGILDKTKMDPRRLMLELSQTATLETGDIATLKAISEKGINLSVDDFGSTNAKWNLLKSFNLIKIDNTFIQMINAKQDNSRMIVSAMFAMAKSLGIKTLAEGVETEEQYQFLKEKDCDLMQGFYFSKPLHTAEFTKLLKTHS
jgi:EAL domain-containing protein (putative c-di-GMP-specific phosphodiesterase class I)